MKLQKVADGVEKGIDISPLKSRCIIAIFS
jgi:hypothetical protein